MGVVYKATDLKLGRAVALKFLPPQWSHDEGAKQRFLREAQAASATNHRNICIIHDIQHTDDGQLFIVMAYYEGQTLKEKLEAGQLPVAVALEIATEVAEGLAKAHSQGVVHRDVKPGNLMITEDGVKVLDFGLAKFADSLQLTMPGSTVGTVAYMSPEQARGEEADARSDVWALGIVLYEMLSGRVPFTGAYPEAIFHAIKNEPVPLLLENRDIPPALQSLVCRALEKDPTRRFQNAREMARDLRLLQGRTVPLDLRTETLPMIQPLMAAPETLTWGRRLRRATTPKRVAAGLFVMAVGVAGVYAWLARPVVRIPVAIAPVANHTGEPELDGYRLALTEMLIEELQDSPNLRVVPYLRLLEVVRRFIGGGDVSSTDAIQAIATEGGATFVVIPSLEYANGTWSAQAQVRSGGDGTVVGSYQTEGLTSSLPRDTAYRLVTLVSDSIQAHFEAHGPGRPFTRRPASARFRNLDAARAFEEAINHYEQLEYASALTALQRAAVLDDQHAMVHAWISRVSLAVGQRDEAVAAARKARQLVTSDTPRQDSVYVEAVLAESQADIEASEQRYRELAARAADDVSARIELADFLKRQNRNQPAIAAYQEVRRLDPGYARVSIDLCQIHVRLDDYPLAEQQARAALEMFRSRRHRGGEAQALLCLADAQRAQGGEERLAEARHNVEAARATFEALGYEFGLSRVYQYLGLVAGAERNYAAAGKFFEEALARSRAVGNGPLEGIALNNLGVTFELLGERSKVLQYYQEARDFYQRTGDERRAAEQEAQAASLLIDYGADQDGALRRLRNARATLERFGSVDFQIIAMEAEAASHLHAGRHEEARRLLHTAISLAKERQLGNRVAFASARLAESYIATAEYEAARVLLEETAAAPAGKDDLGVTVVLGRTYARLGDFAGARERLERALATMDARGQRWLVPAVHTALGELANESGNASQALGSFDRAAALWTDDLPDAASVEATCYRARLDPKAGSADMALDAGIEQARRMRRLDSETLCRLQRASVLVSRQRFHEAIGALDGIPVDGQHRLGPEMQAQVHYWRARAMAGMGDSAGAQSEATVAQSLLEKLRLSLPESYHERFYARAEIREIVKLDLATARR